MTQMTIYLSWKHHDPLPSMYHSVFQTCKKLKKNCWWTMPSYFLSLLSICLSSTRQVRAVIIIIVQVQLWESEPVNQRNRLRWKWWWWRWCKKIKLLSYYLFSSRLDQSTNFFPSFSLFMSRHSITLSKGQAAAHGDSHQCYDVTLVKTEIYKPCVASELL